MTRFMKTVPIICVKSPICTLISQLLEATSKPCKKDQKQGKEKDKKKIDEWREKNDRHSFNFYIIYFKGREFFDTAFINLTTYIY